MRKVIKGVGKMDHENWRKFVNDARSEECKGVIDGDLVEMFQVNEKLQNNFFLFSYPALFFMTYSDLRAGKIIFHDKFQLWFLLIVDQQALDKILI